MSNYFRTIGREVELITIRNSVRWHVPIPTEIRAIKVHRTDERAYS